MGKLLSTLALALVVTPLPARAITIDITLDPDWVPSLGPVTFTVGVSSDTGAPVDINGYTLGYVFDGAELSFIGATQLANFGGGALEDFGSFGNCLSGRCTAGNTPGEDAEGVGALFELEFEVIGIVDDDLADLEVGILDSLFDDITQGTGNPVFQHGAVIRQVYVVPEPSTAALLALGLTGLAVSGRRDARA